MLSKKSKIIRIIDKFKVNKIKETNIKEKISINHY